jgi:tetratricopeptide (TPR) repeat protein
MQRSEILENLVTMARRSKQHATYWLGLSYYEDGKFDVAREWLEQRTLEAKPRSPWSGGARYNLGRTHEQLGEIAEAQELYRADESPQRHGNLLRAQWLDKRSAATSKDQEKPGSSSESAPAKDAPAAEAGS